MNHNNQCCCKGILKDRKGARAFHSWGSCYMETNKPTKEVGESRTDISARGSSNIPSPQASDCSECNWLELCDIHRVVRILQDNAPRSTPNSTTQRSTTGDKKCPRISEFGHCSTKGCGYCSPIKFSAPAPHQETEGWEEQFRANFLSDDGVSEIEFIRTLISKEREKADTRGFARGFNCDKSIDEEFLKESGAEAERNRIRAIAEAMKTPIEGTLWNDLIDELLQKLGTDDTPPTNLLT